MKRGDSRRSVPLSIFTSRHAEALVHGPPLVTGRAITATAIAATWEGVELGSARGAHAQAPTRVRVHLPWPMQAYRAELSIALLLLLLLLLVAATAPHLRRLSGHSASMRNAAWASRCILVVNGSWRQLSIGSHLSMASCRAFIDAAALLRSTSSCSR